MTSPDNPRFTLVIANRLWKEVMGVGLIEPVDELMDSTEASNPQLMDYLVKRMSALDYDMKAFLRELYNFRAAPKEPQSDVVKKPKRNAEIRQRYEEGESVPDLAKAFGISKPRIYQILKGRRK